MTCDTRNVTGDMWHLTPDVGHLVGVNILSKFQLPSSYGLGVMMFWRFGGKGSLTELMCNKSDCRTAPATPARLKSGEGLGFPRADRVAKREFPRVKPQGNPKKQPCQPEANPVLPNSFTQIHFLFLIGFRIGPSKMHRQFCIGLPKMHRRFRIGLPKNALTVLYWPF